MSYDKPISLSLQKEIKRRNLSLDSEIQGALKALRIKSMLARCNIVKQRGYATIVLLYWLLLLPFIMKRLTALWSDTAVSRIFDAKKDAYYRFLNNERFNWRALIYRLALRIIAVCDDTPLKEKTLIIDDTLKEKTGKHMELVSYHFDHTSGRSVLGYQCVQLGYHNGKSFFPLDCAFHTSKKRPNTSLKDIDKRTSGWKRRKEALNKKTVVVVDMVKRAWTQGIDASYVLFDSWYAHDVLICRIVDIGYGVICRLKAGQVKYTYRGKPYTLRQLWIHHAKRDARWIHGFPYKGACLPVTLPKSGEVSLLFVSDGKKEWNAFLCTNRDLEPSDILSYYARRWAIEVFFKDAKQLLYLGKEQSESFDAVVASYSLVMIRYLLLVHILHKYRCPGSLGPLFKDLVETHLKLIMVETMWGYIKQIMIMSSTLFLAEIEPDKFLRFLDIVEDAILMQVQETTAKL
jgi:SRSO17 transposase